MKKTMDFLLFPRKSGTACHCSLLLLLPLLLAHASPPPSPNQPPSSMSSGQSDQATVTGMSGGGETPNLLHQVRSALREALAEFNLTRVRQPRAAAASSMLGAGDNGFRSAAIGVDADGQELPMHEPTGHKTRKTYDFTRSYHVGLSCHDIQATQGASKSGVYLIHPPNLAQGPWRVFCDLETEGGGWMVFQVRDEVEPRENFMRGWEDYKVGFGDFDREFWLGNILIWAVSNADNSTKYELSIDLEDWLYHQNLFYGNAGDSLYSHNGLPFSTFDVDNDQREGDFTERSCARLYKGGWWYGNCHDSNLNGWSLGGQHRSFADGINWYTWTGYNYSLKKTVMKMRPQVNGPIDIGYGNFVLTAPASMEDDKGRNGRGLYEDETKAGENDASDELMRDVNTLTHPEHFRQKAKRVEL